VVPVVESMLEDRKIALSGYILEGKANFLTRVKEQIEKKKRRYINKLKEASLAAVNAHKDKLNKMSEKIQDVMKVPSDIIINYTNKLLEFSQTV
jgi:AAA+ ATPase superfamily predicted ATPase